MKCLSARKSQKKRILFLDFRIEFSDILSFYERNITSIVVQKVLWIWFDLRRPFRHLISYLTVIYQRRITVSRWNEKSRFRSNFCQAINCTVIDCRGHSPSTQIFINIWGFYLLKKLFFCSLVFCSKWRLPLNCANCCYASRLPYLTALVRARAQRQTGPIPLGKVQPFSTFDFLC